MSLRSSCLMVLSGHPLVTHSTVLLLQSSDGQLLVLGPTHGAPQVGTTAVSRITPPLLTWRLAGDAC